MKRNVQNKGNAEWQRLAGPPRPEKIKLRLTPEDVYSAVDGKVGFKDSARRTGGPVKEGGNR